MEMLQGARSRAEMKTIRQALRTTGFLVHPLTEAVSASAVGLIEEYALSSGLQVADAFIAATAIAAGETLVTANQKHFRAIRNLAVKNFRVV
jgi:predicted nucleic acid-binding protein